MTRTGWKRGASNLIFALYERDERIAERLERKISRLEKRMDAIGKRGPCWMPRRAARSYGRGIPLFLIPHVIMQKIRNCGEDLEGVAVKRTERHFYTVIFRTRQVDRKSQSEREGRKRGGESRWPGAGSPTKNRDAGVERAQARGAVMQFVPEPGWCAL